MLSYEYSEYDYQVLLARLLFLLFYEVRTLQLRNDDSQVGSMSIKRWKKPGKKLITPWFGKNDEKKIKKAYVQNQRSVIAHL